MPDKKELLHFSTPAPDRVGFERRIRRLFAEHLSKNGLRLTGPRKLILDFFLGAERHLSQEEIYRALRPRGIGRATVFRTLKMLEESRLVAHVTGSQGVPRFEVNLERPHHDHLICVDCGDIQEVQWPALEKIQDKTCRKIGFVPKWHRHEVFGRCGACAQRT